MKPLALPPGRPVALVAPDGAVQLTRVPELGASVEVRGIGVLTGELFADMPLGGRLILGRTELRLLEPSPELVFQALARGPQVIQPKDAARIAHGCAVGPGSVVVEGGVGSGALTGYLAFLVGDAGRVHGFDNRSDHLGVARRNLETAALGSRVAWHEADLADADERCDIFIADVPAPADVVVAAERCLRPSGRACFYTPLVSQVEAVHRTLGKHGFGYVTTMEQLERRWVVHERGARPDFEMLGHTGFLTFATRLAP